MCEGLCNVTEPRAIKGGGYCWCMAGCLEWFTDNNSYGSCCPDYSIQCLNITIPTCLDVKTQGNALNLFEISKLLFLFVYLQFNNTLCIDMTIVSFKIDTL